MSQQFEIPKDLKQEVQAISCVMQAIVVEDGHNEIGSTLNAVSISEQVTPIIWPRSSVKTLPLNWSINTLQLAKKTKPSAIAKIK